MIDAYIEWLISQFRRPRTGGIYYLPKVAGEGRALTVTCEALISLPSVSEYKYNIQERSILEGACTGIVMELQERDPKDLRPRHYALVLWALTKHFPSKFTDNIVSITNILIEGQIRRKAGVYSYTFDSKEPAIHPTYLALVSLSKAYRCIDDTTLKNRIKETVIQGLELLIDEFGEKFNEVYEKVYIILSVSEVYDTFRSICSENGDGDVPEELSKLWNEFCDKILPNLNHIYQYVVENHVVEDLNDPDEYRHFILAQFIKSLSCILSNLNDDTYKMKSDIKKMILNLLVDLFSNYFSKSGDGISWRYKERVTYWIAAHAVGALIYAIKHISLDEVVGYVIDLKQDLDKYKKLRKMEPDGEIFTSGLSKIPYIDGVVPILISSLVLFIIHQADIMYNVAFTLIILLALVNIYKIKSIKDILHSLSSSENKKYIMNALRVLVMTTSILMGILGSLSIYPIFGNSSLMAVFPIAGLAFGYLKFIYLEKNI